MLASSVWRGDRSAAYFRRGLVLGGAATGVLALLPAAVAQAVLPAGWRWALYALLVLVCAACDGGLVRWRLPQNARQVPSSIIVDAGGAGALRFGFEMGTGLRTYLPGHLPYVALGGALLVAPWWLAPVLGAAFGAARTVMVWAVLAGGDATAWDAAHRRRRHLLAAVGWAAAAVCLAVAAAATPC
ncbi:hypothetical protein GCM10010124_12210 [Pilimelia terevasa]|uniref:Uncharacterized protein n=1 Tax=Pilimelia terevasa TaxID=53372 RepID=A0A8J3FHH1_9ACTN|nr:hypothetical protein [Pilimelia terevasa]GGK21262.1 hypothetical protein GCM10010124_12210 [Pilimelia terevasa]